MRPRLLYTVLLAGPIYVAPLFSPDPLPHLRVSVQNSVGRRFRVVRELTGGGMSRVFLAEETELEREVAIKVLAPSLVDDGVRLRFRQEVLQTARLQHPTIVPLIDTGTVRDGGVELPYFVMPYVRGESVRSRLQHEHQLSLSTTVRILRNVIEALAHAHALGVVHRDVKPENIFLSGSSAVLADFGIAKVITGPRSQELTSPGRAVGSPSYMAPEQLAGEDTTDHRADLYAVGIVAFEMLTGRLPWERGSPSEQLASRARRQLIRLRALRPDAPTALEYLIDRCIDWEPDRRPSSASELLRELDAIDIPTTSTSSFPIQPRTRPWFRTRSGVLASTGVLLAVALVFGWAGWGGSDAGMPVARVAVLYPRIAGSGTDQPVLAEQLYHHLVASLSPVAGLQLVGEVSVPQMFKRGLSREQIADSLHVDSTLALHALPGTDGGFLVSVELQRRLGNRGEIMAGPIAVQSLDRLTPDSVRSLVRLLAGQVVTRLSLLTPNNNVPVTQLLDAWIAWSRGHDFYARRTPDAFREAIAYFERATTLDTAYAQAIAELATSYATALFYQYRTSESPYVTAAKALKLANRAIRLQPNFADGYLARGYVGTVTGAPVEFIEENLNAAKRLSSSNTYSRIWYAALLAAQDRFPEALVQLHDEALADPESPAKQVALALYAMPEREYVTTIRAAEKVHALEPGLPVAARLELWGRILMRDRAARDCRSVAAGPYLGSKALCLEAGDDANGARALTDSLFRIVTGKTPMDTTFDLSLYMSEMTTYYAARKEVSAAQQWLRQTFSESPNGIDRRYMRSGLFSAQLIALSDSLRQRAWQRVQLAAQESGTESLHVVRTQP